MGVGGGPAGATPHTLERKNWVDTGAVHASPQSNMCRSEDQSQSLKQETDTSNLGLLRPILLLALAVALIQCCPREASMPSAKTAVIEILFNKYWDATSQTLSKSVMSLQDVSQAILASNQQNGSSLSVIQPANFMKDLLRGSRASANWPASVAAKKYTGVQRTGGGECFEFIPYGPGQVEPFPDDFKVRLSADRFPVQSISIPLVTKTLGRSDETWLVQTAVNLRVVETHFAVAASFKMIELAHLQMGIKLRKAEIDALFLGKIGDPKNPTSVLVTCEAKQAKDPLIPSQIINQVEAAFLATEVDTVVPIGLRAIKKVGFYLTEFEAVQRKDLASLVQLRLVRDAIYELHPPVKGI